MRPALLTGVLAVGCFGETSGTSSASGDSTSGSGDPSTATGTGSAETSGTGSATSTAEVTSGADTSTTTEPVPESCADAMQNLGETDIDCGGPCPPCMIDEGCSGPADCVSGVCVNNVCAVARACAELPPMTPSGIHPIDPDGPGGAMPFDAFCEMQLSGGGWTLALVSSDDGVATWRFDDSAMWMNNATVGGPASPDHDLKSPAADTAPFTDLLFVHQPSAVFAVYADTVAEPQRFTEFMDTLPPSPICGAPGIPMTDGTLTAGAGPAPPVLWETALYFNRGDLDAPDECGNLNGQFNDATWGPTWNAWVFGTSASDNNFNDPFAASFGPANPNCGACQNMGFGEREFNGRGFGAAIGVTPLLDDSGDATHYIQMYVR